MASISIPFTGRATGEKIADEREAIEESAIDGVCGFGGVLVLVLGLECWLVYVYTFCYVCI